MPKDKKINIDQDPYKKVRCMEICNLASALTFDSDGVEDFSIDEKFRSMLPLALMCKGVAVALVFDVQAFDSLARLSSMVPMSRAMEMLLLKRDIVDRVPLDRLPDVVDSLVDGDLER